MCIFEGLTLGFHAVLHGQTSHNNAIPGITVLELIFISILNRSHVVGPCHNGMARPQVADRGTASDKEGSCE